VRCFGARGYDTTTLDEIAKSAEVAKGTLYLYFQSKADLFASLLLERGFDYFSEVLEERFAACEDAPAAIRAFCKCFAELCLGDRHGMFELFVQLDRGDIARDLSPELKREVRRRLDRILERIAAEIDRGRETGEFEGPEGRRSAGVLWVFCVGVAHLSKGGERGLGGGLELDPHQVLEDGTDQFLRAMAPAGGGVAS